MPRLLGYNDLRRVEPPACTESAEEPISVQRDTRHYGFMGFACWASIALMAFRATASVAESAKAFWI
jgi:hypothetical protein